MTNTAPGSPTTAVNLSTCDVEPIHVPGRIQPHGVLFALREPDLLVEQVGGNTAAHLACPAEQILGQNLAGCLGADAAQAITAALASENLAAVNPVTVTVPVGGQPRPFDAIVHRHDGRLILELEPACPDTCANRVEPDRLVRFTLTRLQGDLRLKDFCEAAAREVRAITGFDRVMVYRFDPDWNGEVFAEEKRADLEPFLGIHYPASDIPAQARRLYTLNWVRHIPDITYDAAPLLPECHPATGRPLDLSFAVLRSVSPIHVEYLQNMGVGASLSISILKGGRLWGLIACHHYTPRFLPYRLRSACESLGVLMSLHLSAKVDSEELQGRLAAQARHARLATALTGTPDVAAALAGRRDDFLGLVGASGAAVVHHGKAALVGRTPTEEQVRQIVGWLREAHPGEVYSTHALPAQHPAAKAFQDRASGLLAVTLGRDHEDCVLWFRPEVVETVRWGGDPHYKRVVTGPNGPRLSPRGSFSLWQEEQRGRSAFWTAADIDAAGQLRAAGVAALARRAAELRDEGRRKDEFLAVLGHELRNPLAPIRNALEVLRRRGGDAATVEWAREVGERQTRHLARMVEDLLDVSRIGQGKLRMDAVRVDLTALLGQAAEDHRPALQAKGLNLVVRLPQQPVWVQGDGTRLTQAVANLLTNAGKFTDRGGRVTLELAADPAAGHARVTVADSGVGLESAALHRVFEAFEQVERQLARTRDGLGLGLALVKGIAELHGGGVSAASDGLGHGSTFGFWLPLCRSAASAADPAAAPAGPTPLRIVVIDDNRDGADSLRLLLELDGHAVRTAYTGTAGIAAAREFRPDVVLCDIGLPDVSGYDVARSLKREAATAVARLIATTGFGSDASERECLAAGIERRLTKPVDPDELRKVLAETAPSDVRGHR